MRTLHFFLWIGAFVLLPFGAYAQRGSGGWCSSNNYSRLFNPQSIVELKGTIVAVEKITPEAGMSTGIHLVVKTERSGNMSAHLGPSWYIDNQDVQFSAGDMVVVKGSKITYNNAPAVIAVSVTKGDQVLTLRDKKGNPAWNGWRKGRRQ